MTQFLGLLAQQPDAQGWKVRQADHALRMPFQEMVKSPWASQWPVGLPEFEGLDGAKVQRFLERLAVRDKVSASTRNQALNALVMFFREGLCPPIG